jgi:glycolate oxidase FAD binding subunit
MTLQPTTAAEVEAAVRDSAQLQVRGGGSKSEATTGTVVDLTRLAGIVDYSPDECVFTALAGTRVRDVIDRLAAHGQYLPFDPPFVDAGATLGGTVASGANGPGRYRYGGIRDFIIGIRLVDGGGRAVRSGGKVVKNAAGFLLHHGVVGSLGRFGVLTELTFKVFPSPEARRTVRKPYGSVSAAFAAVRTVEAMRSDCEAVDFDAGGTLSVTIAGRRGAIDARTDRIARLLGDGDLTIDHDETPAVRLSRFMDARSRDIGCIKVSGALGAWPLLQPHVVDAFFMCAGNIGWLLTDRIDAVVSALRMAQLRGLVLRGPRAGTLAGYLPHNPFEARLLQVLDPDGKFGATQHTP